MAKVKTYTVSVPAELPQIPENFTFSFCESGRFRKQFNNIDTAAFNWFDWGHSQNDLEVHCESELLPDDGGTYEIYSVWNEDANEWGEWLSSFDGEKIDLQEVAKHFQK